MKPYKTLLKDACEEYGVQKSRFIGRAAPVASEEAALILLEGERLRHRAANHHCYAYIIGQNAGVMRYSDDGEPGGTAGLPIIETMKAAKVVDCAVVVSRYFGGVLLGAGGLARAYGHSCALALKAAGVCEMLPTETWLCEVAYPLWDRVQYALKSLPVRVRQIAYATAVSFELQCRQSDAQRVREALARVTDGQLAALPLEEGYCAWVETSAGEG